MPTILYFIANAIPSLKNVVVEALVSKSTITDLNRTTIADKNCATFHANEILKIISITDRKGNTYKTATDIYSDDTNTDSSIFTVGLSNRFDKPVRCYLNLDTAVSNFIYNKPKRYIKYNDEGEITHDGLICNGLFTGTIRENEKSIIKYKNGIRDKFYME